MSIVFKILSIFCCFLVFSNCGAQDKPAILFNDITEIDSYFTITEKEEIIFSGNGSGRYNLQIYKDGRVKNIADLQRDIFKPFSYKNDVFGIYDNNGNELYRTTNTELQTILGSKPLRQIQSSKKGRMLLIRFNNDNGVYILESESGKWHKITDIKNRFHGWIMDDSEQIIYLSYDDKIIKYHLKTQREEKIKLTLTGEKRNIFIDGNYLYFNNNSMAEYHAIYRLKLNDTVQNPKLMLNSNNDVMMPKVKGNFLYFIENEKNEYILKRKPLNGSNSEILTKKGVVYQYDFYQDNQIAMIYSDFNTPKSLVLYDLRNGKLKNISGKSIDIKANYTYRQITAEHSPAYIYKPTKDEIKGVLLFFHPGLHSDFSPRWDTLLMTLVENGYIVVAPNYPMSTGYGKQYQNRPFGDAVRSMNQWKKYLSEKYKNLNLFYMSASSGNILMEECLRMDSKNVKSAVALFGLYSRPRPLFDIPALYILGENDPKVNFRQRTNGLNISNVEVLSFSEEGHWLRRKENTGKVVNSIVQFLKEK